MPDKTEQERYYERANKALDNKEDFDKSFRCCVWTFIGLPVVFFAIAIIVFVLSSLWKAIFGS